MTKLTIEEEQFLEGNRVPYGAVLDASGLEKPDWRKLIRALEKWVIVGGLPCEKAGHTIRLRSGHCYQCGTSSPVFLLRKLNFTNLYIAGSSSGGFLKLGSSRDFKKNIETLNQHKYAGVDDWQVIIAYEVTGSEKIEFKTQRKIKRCLTPEYVRMGGRDVVCLDTLKCKFSRVKKALIESLDNQSRLLFSDDNLEQSFESIVEKVSTEQKEREFVYLDTETTGLSPFTDKIVEVSIIDDDGNVLLDTLVNPEREIPKQASDVHGITDDMVKSHPTIAELIPSINEAIRGKKLVIYNYDYDTAFFPDKLGQASEICCALRAYQSHMKIGKGSKLSDAANHIGYKWDGDAHRALADTRGCRSVWRWLLEQDPEIEHTHSYL